MCFTQVTAGQFKLWKEQYHGQLRGGCTAISEPPVCQYYLEDKLIAYVRLHTAMKGHPAYADEPDEYWVHLDYQRKVH